MISLLASLLATGVIRAEVRMPNIFGDHMVLQQGPKIPVWGWAIPGEEIEVSVGSQKASTKTDADGKWSVELPVLKAGPEPTTLRIVGKNTIEFQDVLIGDVWVCSGQSNMQANMGWLGGKEEVARADHPGIRLFLVPIWLAPTPLDDVEARWVVCTPKTIGPFSAVGYFFGREIHEATKLPVGLIGAASGGSTAQTWMSASAFVGHEKLGGPADLSAPGVANFYRKLSDYRQALQDWERQAETAKAEKLPIPERPKSPLVGCGYPASGSFNAMLAPLLPFRIKGVIWYQGEANAGASNYTELLTVLIADWRRGFGNPDLPFLFVQLPNYIPDNVPPGAWTKFREQQRLVAESVPSTAMAVAIDVGDPKDIHPKYKQPVGHRLALAALKAVYGRDLVSSGPIYEAMAIEGANVRIRFRETGGGLVTSDGGEPRGFVVAGKDGSFLPARAKIENSGVTLSNEQVTEPIVVRYAWEDNPTCNLQNKEGLPARPFSTESLHAIKP